MANARRRHTERRGFKERQGRILSPDDRRREKRTGGVSDVDDEGRKKKRG